MSLMSSDDEDASSDNTPELSPLEMEEILLRGKALLLLLSPVKGKRDDDDNDETNNNNESPISSFDKAEFEVAPLEIEELLPADERDDDHSSHDNNNNNNARPISRRGRTNLFFLLGSLFYVWLAIWDLPDKDSDEMDMDIIDIDNDDFMDKALAGMAAFCYVLDAGMELRQLRLSSPEHEQSTHHLRHNLRRLPALQLAVGLTFGLAALLEFSSTLFASDGVLSLSNHVYLLNAMLLVTGKQWYCMYSISTALEVIADVLFVTGSVNDVVFSYWFSARSRNHPTGEDDGTTSTANANANANRAVAMGDLFSAGLWLIVAILYIVADCCFDDDDDDDDHRVGEYEAIDGNDDEMATFEIPPIIFSSNDDASVSYSADEILVEVKDPYLSSSSSSSNEEKKSRLE
jgi:hypothetical protein